MIKQNPRRYILLWHCSWYLANLPEETNKWEFTNNLLYIYNYCTQSWLEVSKAKFEKAFNNLFNQLEDSDDSEILSPDTIEYIKQQIVSCNEFIEIECSTKKVYELNSSNIDLNKLTDDPLSFISDSEKLNFLAKEDFENACKALAYWLGTATVFHLMRVTENLTYCYWKIFGITKSPSDTMWYFLNKLEAAHNNKTIKNKKKYHASIITELKAIKDQFRNPTQHPDATYSESEALNLFNRSLSVINGVLVKI